MPPIISPAKQAFGAILTEDDIIRELASNNIILHEPGRDCSDNITSTGIDVTLGDTFFLPSPRRRKHAVNPLKHEHVQSYYLEKCHALTFTPAENEHEKARTLGLNVGQRYFILEPGMTVLSHTREFVGSRKHILSQMVGQDYLIPVNLTVNNNCRWSPPNYVDRWPLYITNRSSSFIVLTVGMKIARIMFFPTTAPIPEDGKFNLDSITNQWELP